jgi:hypothetical protein
MLPIVQQLKLRTGLPSLICFLGDAIQNSRISSIGQAPLEREHEIAEAIACDQVKGSPRGQGLKLATRRRPTVFREIRMTEPTPISRLKLANHDISVIRARFRRSPPWLALLGPSS